MIEQWHQIDGFPDYTINNYGVVYNTLKKRYLYGSKDYIGYRYHRLHVYNEDGKSIYFEDVKTHQLVSKYFVPNPLNLQFPNHIDENKFNSRADNLEWVTSKQNCNHGNRNYKISLGGKPVCEYGLDGKYIRTWISSVAVSKVYDIAARSIHDPCRLHKGTSYGRQWRYLEECNKEDIESTFLHGSKSLENYNYDVFIPDELLIPEDDEISISDIIDELIEDISLNNTHLRKLNKIKEMLILNGII